MAIGLTFVEYVERQLTPRGTADPAFRQAAEIEREQIFPMNTETATNHLRSRGYECRAEMLNFHAGLPIIPSAVTGHP